MNNLILKFYVIVSMFIFQSCEESIQSDIPVIDLDELLNSDQRVRMNDLFSQTKVILLENSEQSYLRFPKLMRVFQKKDVLIKDNDNVFLFNIKDGTLSSRVAEKGNGPDQFYRSLKEVSVHPDFHDIFILKSPNELKKANKLNSEVHVIPNPSTYSGFESGIINGIAIKAENDYYAYVTNMSGEEKVRLINFDNKGQILNTYENHLKFKKKAGSFRIEESSFHFYNDDLFFKEKFNDTLYRVDKNNLSPKYIFTSKLLSPKYINQDLMSKYDRENKIFISNIRQNREYIFFHFEYRNKKRFGFYKKDSKKVGFINPYSDQWNDWVSISPFILSQNRLIFLAESWQMAELLSPDEYFDIFNTNGEVNPAVVIYQK